MKRIINISLLFVLGALFVSSCSNKIAIFHPYNDNVSWEAENVTGPLTDANVVPVKLVRGIANSELQVPYTFTDNSSSSAFGGNRTGSVTFAVGEYEKVINVEYEYTALTAGEVYSFTFAFDEDQIGHNVAAYTSYTYNGMMSLEYDETIPGNVYELEYYRYRLYNSAAYGGYTAYVDGSLWNCTDSPKIIRAKGTQDYYLLKAFHGQLEFRCVPPEDFYVDQYTGYNDHLTVWSSNSNYYRWDFNINGRACAMMLYGRGGKSAYFWPTSDVESGKFESGTVLCFQVYGVLDGANFTAAGYWTWILQYLTIK